jgi:hypothetical protein
MGELAAGAQIDLNSLAAQPGIPTLSHTASRHPIRAVAYLAGDDREDIIPDTVEPVETITDAIPLFRSLVKPPPLVEELDEIEQVRTWRVTDRANIPPGAIGQMVHKRSNCGYFPVMLG